MRQSFFSRAVLGTTFAAIAALLITLFPVQEVSASSTTPSWARESFKKKSAPKVKSEKDEAQLPRRTSSRLRGIAAESEVAKRKANDENDAFLEAERAKRIRKPDAFSFGDMIVSGGKIGDGSLVDGLGLGKGSLEKSYERTFGEEDIKKTTDKDLKALREEMSGLQLWEAWEPNRMRCLLFWLLYEVC